MIHILFGWQQTYKATAAPRDGPTSALARRIVVYVLRLIISDELYPLHRPFIKFPETSARAMNHDIEMTFVQSQVCTNPFFFIFCQIEPEEHLNIAFVWHLLEDL
jgi:hypothetical protein